MTEPERISSKLVDRWESLREYQVSPDEYVRPDLPVTSVFEVPRRFRGRAWSATPEDDRVRAWIEALAESEGRNLVLLGDVGAGKSRLAWLALQELWHAGCVVFGGQTASVLDAWRAEPAVFEWWSDADVVLLDDVGAERMTDWSQERLDMFFDYRWSESLSTIVTSNLDPAGLRAHLGERIYSRLRDPVTAVHVKGVDHRAE